MTNWRYLGYEITFFYQDIPTLPPLTSHCLAPLDDQASVDLYIAFGQIKNKHLRATIVRTLRAMADARY